MSVTFTQVPSAISVRTAGRPSAVAGTLIITFGRATAAWSRRASSTVPAVSCASRGLTSMLTRPSRPPLLSNTGRSASQAACTSSMASDS